MRPKSVVLIYPPAAKPCEPPAGIARLAAALNTRGIPHALVDANVEGLLALLQGRSAAPDDTWTKRALGSMARDIEALRNPSTYRSPSRYTSAVKNLNRLLARSAREKGITVSLCDYQDRALSPLRSADLLRAAAEPEQNPFYAYFSERLGSLIEERQPAVAGFSLSFLSQALTAFAMIGFLRRRFPGLRIVLGGGLVTSWMRRPGGRMPFDGLVDACVAGPGEDRLDLLLGTDESEGEGNGDAGHYTPDYTGLVHNAYLSPGFVLPYSASTGCSWRKCSFCPEKVEGSRYRPLPPERVMTDIALLAERTAPSLIHFLDSAMSPALLRALAASPTPPANQPVKWYGFTRVSDELADDAFCAALKRAGCVMLKLGIESGDQQVLDTLGKGIEIATASRALRALKRAGIATYVYLLFGAPAEDRSAAQRTLDFTAAHSGAIDFLNLAVFNMPRGDADARSYGSGSFYEGDLSLYTGFTHPAGWSRKRVRAFLEGEFKRHPAVAPILRREPPCFTSNHAPFFTPLLFASGVC